MWILCAHWQGRAWAPSKALAQGPTSGRTELEVEISSNLVHLSATHIQTLL